MEASSYGGLSLNLRQSTRQVVAYPASLVKVARLQTFFCRPPICWSGRSQDQTGCASPAPSLPPNSYLVDRNYFSLLCVFLCTRALNLLIPRVTFGRCLAPYVSRRSTHLASTNSTLPVRSHLADLLSRGFPTPVHIQAGSFRCVFSPCGPRLFSVCPSITLDCLFRCS
jgi:hypothetical protein